jgi:hypothetical protein
MNKMIERLKTEEAAEAQAEYQDGRQAGESWANDEASPRQLKALERLDECEPPRDVSYHLSVMVNGLNHGITEGLFSALHPRQKEFDRPDVKAFWQSVLGEDAERIEDQDFARGFCEAALEAWRNVKADV